jgi:hypothetical protein
MRASLKAFCTSALLLSFSLISACDRTQGKTPRAEVAPQQPALSIPTDKEIADLKREWVDSGHSRKLSLDVQFDAFLPTVEERERHRKAGTIPFLITGTMLETKTVAGKDVERQLTNDKVRICIRDKDGKVVLNTIEPLIKLCAS